MENGEIISAEYLILIITATIAGTLARTLTIKQDYRQYPSHPTGYLIHFVLGAISAALGAFIIPALMTKNFTAVTFLTLAIQQFREVRKLEKESLQGLEGTEYTIRGDSYIDGIAKTFESRNYYALLVAFVTALTIQLLDLIAWLEITAGLIVGALLFSFLKRFTRGKRVKDFATITRGKIEIKDSDLYVNGFLITNLIGEEQAKTMFKEEGIAAVITPNKPHFRLSLEHFGQRQAMFFEACRSIGKRRYGFQDLAEGFIVIVLVPIVDNFDLMKETILHTPLLESVKKSPQLMTMKVTEGAKK